VQKTTSRTEGWTHLPGLHDGGLIAPLVAESRELGLEGVKVLLEEGG